MKKKNLLVMLLVLTMLTALFTACGAQSSKYAAEEAAPMEEPMMYATTDEIVFEEEVAVEDMSVSMQSAGGTADEDGAMDVDEVKTYAEKIIYSGRSRMETTEFDETLLALDRAVQQYGGFVQDSNINGNTRRNSDGTTVVVNRWGYYVVRIPTDAFDAFMAMTAQIGNVTSSSRTAENVTSQYTDYEARLESLNTQEERLLSMLEESGDLESLIALEARLSEVRYEIESIERNLRNLDQRLAYSTVTLEIQEVEVYTPTATTQRTFGEKIADAFSDSWKGFGRGCQNFAIWLVAAFPTLLMLAFIAGGVIGIVTAARKADRKRRKSAMEKENTEE